MQAFRIQGGSGTGLCLVVEFSISSVKDSGAITRDLISWLVGAVSWPEPWQSHSGYCCRRWKTSLSHIMSMAYNEKSSSMVHCKLIYVVNLFGNNKCLSALLIL